MKYMFKYLRPSKAQGIMVKSHAGICFGEGFRGGRRGFKYPRMSLGTRFGQEGMWIGMTSVHMQTVTLGREWASSLYDVVPREGMSAYSWGWEWLACRCRPRK